MVEAGWVSGVAAVLFPPTGDTDSGQRCRLHPLLRMTLVVAVSRHCYGWKVVDDGITKRRIGGDKVGLPGDMRLPLPLQVTDCRCFFIDDEPVGHGEGGCGW
nr:hypothetical protein Iba_scaffold927919CG0010 [Ipomoea batatas]GMD14583.1 hypothetical protein Iba_chr07bCG7810 [Ipomoea batatas]GME03604.1 hypothetical protein Iba_scaffold970CG0100 [Ipomoea batatas]GME09397.1 hypothetical protein Iba_scaffold8679CG0010 [Ipomoea batatas]